MVTHFGGEGPGGRVCHAHKGIAATIGEGCSSDLHVVAGVFRQVCAWCNGHGIACDAHLKTGHINRIDHGVVIGAVDDDITCAHKYVFIKFNHERTRYRSLGGTVCGCEITDFR